MQIIDFMRKGNMARFLLGDANSDYWGDDWNDAPYDCNAGEVYDKYVKWHRDIIFPFDDLVLEPCDGAYGDTWVTKEDMKNRHVPCIIVVPKELREDTYKDAFRDWVGADGIQKFFFGDEMEPEKLGEQPVHEHGISFAELVHIVMGNTDSKECETLLRFMLKGDNRAVNGNFVTLHGLLTLVQHGVINPDTAETLINSMKKEKKLE